MASGFWVRAVTSHTPVTGTYLICVLTVNNREGTRSYELTLAE